MTKSEFIPTVAPLIVAEGKKRGYTIFSAVIAQAIIESGWGQSGLAKYNNLFGLKCGSKWTGASVNMKTKEEYSVGTLTSIRSNFRAYPDIPSGIAGYYDFIATKRYANLKTARTPLEYCQFLKADGYATSSSYVNTLMNTINKYDLTKYDGVTQQIVQSYAKDIDTIVDEVIDKKWGNGQDRKMRLTAAGYDYAEVQKRVNAKLKTKKDIDTIVDEVIDKKWGNGAERKQRLEAAGYNYEEVQKKVNLKVRGY